MQLISLQMILYAHFLFIMHTFLKGFPQFDNKIASITVSLRERMRFYKLRVTPNAASIASTFNEQFKPEIIPEINDPFLVDWIQDPLEDSEVLVGERVCIII